MTDSDFWTLEWRIPIFLYTVSDASWLHSYYNIISVIKSCVTNDPVVKETQQHVCYINRALLVLVCSRLLTFR